MADQQWYFLSADGNVKGPFSAAELKRLAETGVLRSTDQVRTQGMSDWQPANEVAGLFQVSTPPLPSSEGQAVVVKCQCGQKYRLNPELRGKHVKCRGCGRPIPVPAQTLTTTPASQPQTHHVSCPHCKHLLIDDGTYAGQPMACPSCGGQFIMPGTSQPQPPPDHAGQPPLPGFSLTTSPLQPGDNNRSSRPQPTAAQRQTAVGCLVIVIALVILGWVIDLTGDSSLGMSQDKLLNRLETTGLKKTLAVDGHDMTLAYSDESMRIWRLGSSQARICVIGPQKNLEGIVLLTPFNLDPNLSAIIMLSVLAGALHPDIETGKWPEGGSIIGWMKDVVAKRTTDTRIVNGKAVKVSVSTGFATLVIGDIDTKPVFDRLGKLGP